MKSGATCGSDDGGTPTGGRNGPAASSPPPELREIVPSTTVAGVAFNVQSTGNAAIGLRGAGFGKGAEVLFNYVPAPSVFRGPMFITAEVPAELYARAGVVRVAVRNPDGKVSGALRFDVLPPPPAGRAKGVFIIGCPRSGTSVLSWALAEHASFWTGPESDFLTTLYGQGRLHEAYRQAHDRSDSGWLRQQDVGFAEFAANLGLGVEALFASRSAGARWIDATPGYTLMVPALLSLFPSASFLHIVRDGRAVVSSMMSSGFDVHWGSSFAEACRTWVHYVRKGLEVAGTNRDRVIEVRHEHLVGRTRSELRRVFAFLGESPSERSVEFIATKRINSSYGNSDARDIRLPKDPAGGPKRPWDQWTTEEKDTFAEIAGNAMSELGYEIDDAGTAC